MFFALFSVTFGSNAQNLTAFNDYRDYFFIFDNGVSAQREYQPVKSFKSGGKCLAYVDNLGKFKMYFEGEITELERFNIGNYAVTENLVVYKVDQELLVFDNGKVTSLAYYPAYYGVGDSIVAFLDRATKYLKVYYRGTVTPVADGLMTVPAKGLRVGDNILAFIDSQDRLYTFYHGRLEELMYNPRTFRTSLNTVAYVDASSLEFGIFHKGEVYEVETFEPASYKMGDDIVAYVDESGSFKIFYDGEVITVSSFEPEFYKVIDDLVIYGENSFFKVYYQGEEYTLENFIPVKFFADEATLAYIDQLGFLQCFYKGETYALSDEAVREITVSGNTVAYKLGLNTNKVFCKGKIY